MFAIRGPFAALGGALCALVLFFGLSRLVSVPFVAQPFKSGTDVIFTPQIPESSPISLRDPRVEPEPPIIEPGPPRLIPGGDPPVTFERPPGRAIDPVPRRSALPVSGVDGDVLPRVRVNPDYPPQALVRGTEGWVQVRFTVTAIGTVRDAVVVASEPGTTFDDAALKAIARWRYNPRIVNGEAVESVGLQTIIRFELDN